MEKYNVTRRNLDANFADGDVDVNNILHYWPSQVRVSDGGVPDYVQALVDGVDIQLKKRPPHLGRLLIHVRICPWRGLTMYCSCAIGGLLCFLCAVLWMGNGSSLLEVL